MKVLAVILSVVVLTGVMSASYFVGIEVGSGDAYSKGKSDGMSEGRTAGYTDGLYAGAAQGVSVEDYNALLDDYNKLKAQPTYYIQAPTYQPRTVTCDSYEWLSGNVTTTCR